MNTTALALLALLSVHSYAAATDQQDINARLRDRAAAGSVGHPQRRKLREATRGKDAPVQIDSKFITINRVKYSRYGASSGDLGSFGELLKGKDKSRVNWQGSAPKPWVVDNVKLGTKVTLTKSEVDTLSLTPKVSATIAVEGVPVAAINGGASINVQTQTSAGYALQELMFESEVEVTKWLTQYGALCEGTAADWTASPHEDSCYTLDYLRNLGSDLRVVTTAWILMPDSEEFTSSENWKQCIDASFSLEAGDAAHVVKGGAEVAWEKCTNISVTFSPDTVMAWEASSVEWRRDPNDAKALATPLRALRLSKDTYPL